jgi:molybdopterin-containing oxidoreductase family iron-sulfur binding subunit
MKNKHTISRRNFLVKSITALSAIYVVPDIFSNVSAAKHPNIEVSSKTRWGMSIDVDKCVDGCTSCIDACADTV